MKNFEQSKQQNRIHRPAGEETKRGRKENNFENYFKTTIKLI
jgi:hypothetical protein